MSFAWGLDLKHHMAIHNRQSLPTCSVCHRVSSNLKNHARHEARCRARTSSLLSCRFCERKFAGKVKLMRHEDCQHSNDSLRYPQCRSAVQYTMQVGTSDQVMQQQQGPCSDVMKNTTLQDNTLIANPRTWRWINFRPINVQFNVQLPFPTKAGYQCLIWQKVLAYQPKVAMKLTPPPTPIEWES